MTNEDIKVSFTAIRKLIDASGYGGFVSDAQVTGFATAVLEALDKSHTKEKPMASWRVAKSLITLRDQVNVLAPNRDKSNDGTIGDTAHAATHSEHNPDENGVVRAEDISNDPAHGMSSQKLAEALVASRDPRILYIISNRRIINSQVSPWVWRAYNGSNPHDHHVHISVVSDPSLYDDTRPWDLSALGAVIPTQPTTSVNNQRFIGITATEFGGRGDPNTAAYDGHFIDDDEFGCALPYKFTGERPDVRVFKDGNSVICKIVDVGPWNIHDPYWVKGDRPQAESGTDQTGRHTNLAGIDLTPKAAQAIGLSGKGIVDWEFVTDALPTVKKDKPMATPVDMQQLLDLLNKLQAQGTTPVVVPAVPVTPPLSWIDKLFGGQALVGSKTATGILGMLATGIPLITGILTDPTTITAATTIFSLFAGFSGLGLAAKIDRGIQAVNQVGILIHKYGPTDTTKPTA